MSKKIEIKKEQFRQGPDDDEGEKFVCPICRFIVWKPLMCSKCYAIYCTTCLDSSFKCWKCGEGKFENSLPIERIMDGLRFECPNACKKPILYKEYKLHLDSFCQEEIIEKKQPKAKKEENGSCFIF